MAWIHTCGVTERKQDIANGCDEGRIVAARQIGAPDGTSEERIADEEVLPFRSSTPDLQTHAARAMTRRVMRTRLELTERDHLPWRIEMVDPRWRRIDAEAKHRTLLYRAFVEEEIVAM